MNNNVSHRISAVRQPGDGFNSSAQSAPLRLGDKMAQTREFMRLRMNPTFPSRIASGRLCAAFLFSLVAVVQPLRAGTSCSVPGTYADLQSALNNPNCSDIVLAAGTYYGSFTISRSVTIIGAGASTTVLDAQNNGIALNIDATASGSAWNTNVYLEGVTIQNGYAGENSRGEELPGGIVDENSGSLTIVNSVITRNRGGVFFLSTGNLTIADSTVSSNTWVADGNITTYGNFNLIRSTVTGNDSRMGVLLLNCGGDVWSSSNIIQSTLEGNKTLAIDVMCGDVFISSNTIANNSAGLNNYSDAGYYGGDITLKGNIFANNGRLNCFWADVDHRPVDAGSNFSDDGSCRMTIADPKLGPLQNNGGPTMTMLPQPGSPVIGKGDCTDATNNPLAVDQRYGVRPTSGCDAGAIDTHASTYGSPDALWWRLNESSGNTAYDSSPHSLDGTVYSKGGPPQWSFGGAPTLLANTRGIYSGAYNTFVSTYYPATTATDNIAMTAWVNCGGCVSSTNDMLLFYIGVFPSTGYGLSVRHSDGHVLLYLGGLVNPELDFGWAMPANGSWIHLAVVRSSGVWRLYVNGKATGASFNNAPIAPNYFFPVAYTMLGADTTGSHHFGGFIGEFRVYNRALPAGELHQLATGALAGTPALPAAPAAGMYRIQNLKSGLVLGVAGASMSQAANIVQWNSNVSPDQKWTLTPAGDGAYTITDVNSGMVIGVAGASLNQGTTLIQWPLNGSTDQQWRFRQIGPNFMITNVKSGLQLDIQSGSIAPGAQAFQWAANDGFSQHWALIPVQ